MSSARQAHRVQAGREAGPPAASLAAGLAREARRDDLGTVGEDALSLGPAGPEDVEEVLGLIAEVFGRRGARTRAHWRWAYGAAFGDADPLAGRSWIARRGGRVVAHLGARPVRTWWAGRERVLLQLTDACSDPGERLGLRRRGTFVSLARGLLEDAHRRGEALAFAWPLEGARRIAERLLGFERVREEWVLVGEAQRLAGLAPPESAAAPAPLDRRVRWLWERCAGGWGASAVRDADLLRRRYLECPGVRYELLSLPDARGNLAALAVLRISPWELADALPIAEWLVPTEERGAARALLAACARRALALGTNEIALSVPEHSPWFEILQELSFLVHPAPLALVGLPLDPALDLDLLREGWWHGLGDSELV